MAVIPSAPFSLEILNHQTPVPLCELAFYSALSQTCTLPSPALLPLLRVVTPSPISRVLFFPIIISPVSLALFTTSASISASHRNPPPPLFISNSYKPLSPIFTSHPYRRYWSSLFHSEYAFLLYVFVSKPFHFLWFCYLFLRSAFHSPFSFFVIWRLLSLITLHIPFLVVLFHNKKLRVWGNPQ